MKLLTANFITCSVKSCQSVTPALSFRDAELAREEIDFSPLFLRNILPRIDWPLLQRTAKELGFPALPETKPELSPIAEGDEEGVGSEEEQKLLKELHSLLLETSVQSGKLVCANCGHEYPISQGIANFLLPNHLV
ncbi:Trm112p-domain-containing protein [Ascobolus immersus RN42]|uniref:Trm112p-domain-containing protein n=1 Tax=Ascobolus immersus RN42 TaxID=1160509 RepID=A0A3N4HPX1_ASCIM|nr:Trm112p-domain-containing protein [Ascobolus immersus RN42]